MDGKIIFFIFILYMKTKKCFSKCRKIPEDSCKEKSRICQFTKGSRKYCRISKLYTLDNKCNMIKKKIKIKPKEASQKIGNFILNITKKHRQKQQQEKIQQDKQKQSLASKKIGNFIVNITKKHRQKQQQEKIQQDKQKQSLASKKIGKFMLNTENKRKAFFLKSICSDSGVCLAFGTEINKINQFFNGFTGFEYAVSPIKKIGAVSSNGFVKEIKYSREGYDAYAVLKSSTNEKSDNLLYEYEVGKFINKQNKIFPCFLETYGSYFYLDNASWKHCKDVNTITPEVLKNSFHPVNKTINYSHGCVYSKYISILIQHIKNADSVEDFLTNAKRETDVMKQYYLLNFELLHILYQIYMPLSTLSTEFTHYDLHMDNVLLYEPIKNSYITYNYHLKSGLTVKFNSKYIAKIIDYGRSYYYEDTNNNSKKTYDTICKIKNCDPNCGEDVGLTILGLEIPPGSFQYISSQVKNQSADLRLIKLVQDEILNHSNVQPDINTLLNIIKFTGTHGTKQVTKSGLPHKINNVKDVCAKIEELITKPEHILRDNSRFMHLTKIGDFHIYEDKRPMRFVKT